jgi:hypothetical protein
MKTRYLLTVLLLALTLPAAAQFRTIAEAYEIELVNLRLPQNAGGTIAYKTCDACEYQRTRVSPDTRWILNGQAMSLVKFRQGIAQIKDRNNRHLTVLHHLADDRVTKVALTIR